MLVIPDDGEIDFEQQDPFGGEGAAAADFCGVFGAGDDFTVAVDGGEFTGGAEFDEERGSGGGGGEDPPGRRSGFRCGGEGERGEERQQEPCPPERMKKMNLSQGKEKIPIVKLICSGVIPRRRFLKRQHGNYTAESMVLQVISPASP